MAMLMLLILIGLIAWFWQDSLRARERAREASKRMCRQYNVQLLDDTVALDRLRVRRLESGRLAFERRYLFEFTTNGAERLSGVVMMTGIKIEVLALDGGDLFIP